LRVSIFFPSGTTTLPGPTPWVPGTVRRTPAAATVLALATDPGTDPATWGTGSPINHIFHSSLGAAPARSPVGAPRVGSLAQPTEGATTEVTAEAAAAVPAEEAYLEVVRGRGGKSHPLLSRNPLSIFSLRSHPSQILLPSSLK
jgi:hypothetical protein